MSAADPLFQPQLSTIPAPRGGLYGFFTPGAGKFRTTLRGRPYSWLIRNSAENAMDLLYILLLLALFGLSCALIPAFAWLVEHKEGRQ